MASRIRTVKPELFRHEGLYEAEQETGMPLRLAFIGLFTVADRDGRFRWQPRQLKLDVMPYDLTDFSRVLDALVTRGFVVHYKVDGEHYGAIPTFPKHQVINNREKSSLLPSVEDSDEVFSGLEGNLATREPRVSHASPTPLVQDQVEGKGREGKGKEGNMEREGEGEVSVAVASAPAKQTAVRKTKIPSPFLLTVEMRAWAAESAPGVDLKTETEKFVDYWRAEAKTKADWPATWRNWMRKSQQDVNRSPGRGGMGGVVNRQQQIEDASAAVIRQIEERELLRQQQESDVIGHGDVISPVGEVIRVD